MNYEQMKQYVFQKLLEGLCQGKSLYRLAGEIVVDLGTIMENHRRSASPAKAGKGAVEAAPGEQSK